MIEKEDVFNAVADSNLEIPSILKINGKECCFNYTGNSLGSSIENFVIDDFNPMIEFQEYSDVCFEVNKLHNISINELEYEG
ncbi:MAG: hypothetical protein ACOC2F_05250 [Bacteroidota bacterium]